MEALVEVSLEECRHRFARRAVVRADGCSRGGGCEKEGDAMNSQGHGGYSGLETLCSAFIAPHRGLPGLLRGSRQELSATGCRRRPSMRRASTRSPSTTWVPTFNATVSPSSSPDRTSMEIAEVTVDHDRAEPDPPVVVNHRHLRALGAHDQCRWGNGRRRFIAIELERHLQIHARTERRRREKVIRRLEPEPVRHQYPINLWCGAMRIQRVGPAVNGATKLPASQLMRWAIACMPS